MLLLLSGCSSKPSLELISSTVDIRDDRSGGIGITSGEREGEMIQPISLSYRFVLKNTGKKTLGGMEKFNNETFEAEDGIKIYIEPNENLREITEEVIGLNMYNEEEMQQANLSLGKTSNPILGPNQEGEYTFDFDLGALEENPVIRIAPSSEQLDKLKRNAMDATLIVSIEKEEIARFNLNNSN